MHGNNYDYSLVNTSEKKVTIKCNRCSKLLSIARSKHLSGQGCGKCKRSLAKRLTVDEYRQKFINKHGRRFDYTKFNQVETGNSEITIGCPDHGFVVTTPRQHLYGSGCKKCGIATKGLNNKITTDEFIRRSVLNHNSKYDYSLVDLDSINGMNSKVPIVCRQHGIFYQVAADHSNGHGCSKCLNAGFNPSIPYSIYVLKGLDCLKVGITSRVVHLRIKEISKSCGKSFKLLYFIKFENGQVAKDIESKILIKLKERFSQPLEKFDGHTECFLTNDSDYFISEVVQAHLRISTAHSGLSKPKGNQSKGKLNGSINKHVQERSWTIRTYCDYAGYIW